MFPWGSIISLAGSAVSGIMTAINNKRSKEIQDQEYAREQAEASARAYEDPLSRSENQQVLNEYDRRSRKQIDAAKATGVITGETQEAALARQKAAIEGRADLMSNIAAKSSAKKDYYLDQLEQSKRNQYAAEQQRLANRNQTYANLASNAASAFGNIVDSYGTQTQQQAERAANLETNTNWQNSAKLSTAQPVYVNQAENQSALDNAMANNLARINANNYNTALGRTNGVNVPYFLRYNRIPSYFKK